MLAGCIVCLSHSPTYLFTCPFVYISTYLQIHFLCSGLEGKATWLLLLLMLSQPRCPGVLALLLFDAALSSCRSCCAHFLELQEDPHSLCDIHAAILEAATFQDSLDAFYSILMLGSRIWELVFSHSWALSSERGKKGVCIWCANPGVYSYVYM